MHRYLALFWATIALGACGAGGEQCDKARRFAFAIPTDQLKPALGQAGLPEGVQAFALGAWAFVVADGGASQDYPAMVAALRAKAPGLHGLLGEAPPLERIYKLGQQKDYSARQGQLVACLPGTKRYVLTLEIVNDPAMKAEYKRVHAKGMAWPEITRNMKQMGIKDMEIYMDGYRAYLVMDTAPEFDLEKDGERWSKLPREAEWQAYVAKFQKVDPESKATEKWESMMRYP